MKARILAALSSAALVACGGGGGGGSDPTVPSASAPTVTVSLSQDKIRVGESVAVNWTSTNATSCTGSDGLSGTLQSSGTQSVTPTAGGQFRYTITCSGPGGNTAQTATLTVPFPVLQSSYENKNREEITDTDMPHSYRVGVTSSTAGHFHNRPFAIADFLQNGKFQVAVFQAMYTSNAQLLAGRIDSPSKMYIYERDSSNSYVDVTSRVIKNDADRFTCITPSYALVSDINNDKKPDIFVACTGLDYTIDGVWQDANSKQFYFLSQPDGTYVKRSTDFEAVAHQCSAADITGDRNIDILCVDPGKLVFALIGDGAGNFTRRTSGYPDIFNKGVGGIELVPNNGVYDLYLGGVTYGGDPLTSAHFGNRYYKNTGNNDFANITPVILPSSVAPVTVTDTNPNGYAYSAFHDVIFKNGYVYLLQYDWLYGSAAVRKINLENVNDVTKVYEFLGPINHEGNQLITLMKPVGSFIVPLMTCSVSKTDSRWAASTCAVKIPM